MAQTTIIIAVVAAFLVGISAEEWNHLRLKYDVIGGYYNIPLLVSELKKDSKWAVMVEDEDLNCTFWSYKDDPRVAIGYDFYGNIAGVRVSYIKEDLPKRAIKNNLDFPYRYDDKPMFSSATYWGKEVWYNTVLFVNPIQLKRGGRTFYYNMIGDDVFLKLNGNWTLIPRDQCKAEALGFTEQGCFLGMGKHYFYGVTPTAACEDIHGIFLLYESGSLIGLGLIPFGTFTSTDERTWFEDPPAAVAKIITPNSPKCLGEWMTNYGTTALHLFFKNSPRTTLCTWPYQKSDQCKKSTSVIGNLFG